MPEQAAPTSRRLMRWITSPSASRVRELSRALALTPFVARRTRLRVEGRENLKDLDGQCIVVANHASDLDTALIFHVLPRRLTRNLTTGAATDRFFVNARTTAVPSMLFNIYPVDRPGRTHRGEHRGMSSQLVERGMSLLIYPEGSRRPNRARRFSTGPARLAMEYDLPVLPISIVGTREAWAPDQKKARKGRSRVVVQLGRPLSPRANESAAQFTDRISRTISEGQHQLSARRGR